MTLPATTEVRVDGSSYLTRRVSIIPAMGLVPDLPRRKSVTRVVEIVLTYEAVSDRARSHRLLSGGTSTPTVWIAPDVRITTRPILKSGELGKGEWSAYEFLLPTEARDVIDRLKIEHKPTTEITIVETEAV